MDFKAVKTEISKPTNPLTTESVYGVSTAYLPTDSFQKRTDIEKSFMLNEVKLLTIPAEYDDRAVAYMPRTIIG